MILIVGAGLTGITVAHCLAEHGFDIWIVEERSHIGGNCYDTYDDYGIRIQKYGPHIFHTENDKVWNFLKCFTEWNDYVHRVLAWVDGKFMPLPLEETSSDHVKEIVYDDYNRKMWGDLYDKLDPSVRKRLKFRYFSDTRYFTDKYQGIPKHGFTRMMENMLDHPKIRLMLNTPYKEIKWMKRDWLVWTGSIDCYFDLIFGQLSYRSMIFKYETKFYMEHQPGAVVNYPYDYDYIRCTEFKKLYQQKHDFTTICYEYPCDEFFGEKLYPILTLENMNLRGKYIALAEKEKRVLFAGRLGTYSYLNMDQAILSGLKTVKEILDGSK